MLRRWYHPKTSETPVNSTLVHWTDCRQVFCHQKMSCLFFPGTSLPSSSKEYGWQRLQATLLTLTISASISYQEFKQWPKWINYQSVFHILLSSNQVHRKMGIWGSKLESKDKTAEQTRHSHLCTCSTACMATWILHWELHWIASGALKFLWWEQNTQT